MAAGEEHLDLFHRTTPAVAAAIRKSGAMTSKENTAEAFFSTHAGGHIAGYGEALVHIRIPIEWVERGWARLDDEFELDDGEYEEHYAIDVVRLRPEHFVADGSDQSHQERP